MNELIINHDQLQLISTVHASRDGNIIPFALYSTTVAPPETKWCTHIFIPTDKKTTTIRGKTVVYILHIIIINGTSMMDITFVSDRAMVRAAPHTSCTFPHLPYWLVNILISSHHPRLYSMFYEGTGYLTGHLECISGISWRTFRIGTEYGCEMEKCVIEALLSWEQSVSPALTIAVSGT